VLFDYIRAGMVLTQDVFDDRGNLLLENGSILTDTYLVRLRQLGVRQLRIFDPYAASLKSQPVIPAELRQELALCFQTLINLRWQQSQSSKLRYLYLQRMNSMVTEVIAHLESQIPDIINLSVRQPTEDEISHSVNVCLLSIVTGLYLKIPASVLSEIAIGALLHDIGKTALPEDAAPENSFIHATYGKDLLLANKFSPTVARIAAEHHERPDGSGRPLGLIGKDIHPLSRIVAIANYYDRAIACEKETQLSRQEIVENMLINGNAAFDLTTLRAFFQTIAVYPVGSLVKLNNSKLAYVLRNKVRMPLRPCVELADASRLEIDLALQPNITIKQLIAE
jgi:putative nucleotidyltransferase with HDIG domain